jgi:hypothetical protein
MKLSCLKLLNVNNSSEAEKVIQQQLIEWKKQPIGESNIESQLPAQKRKVFVICKVHRVFLIITLHIFTVG